MTAEARDGQDAWVWIARRFLLCRLPLQHGSIRKGRRKLVYQSTVAGLYLFSFVWRLTGVPGSEMMIATRTIRDQKSMSHTTNSVTNDIRLFDFRATFVSHYANADRKGWFCNRKFVMFL